jgi:hypothetical protein
LGALLLPCLLLLLLLPDDGVQLHSLPELQLVSTASRTARGAAAFAWDDGRQLLATAVRKKVRRVATAFPLNSLYGVRLLCVFRASASIADIAEPAAVA